MFINDFADWQKDGLAVLVPSRGRPETVAELHKAFADTSNATTMASLTFVVDEDDPARGDYAYAVDELTDGWLSLVTVPGGTMVKALNEAAALLLARPARPFALGFMGDDHRPRTRGWDRDYLDALHSWAEPAGSYRGVAMVYGNDTIQGQALPTQVAMTTETVRRLGWMAPPVFRHLFVDNAWLHLGRATSRITYLPDVVVEHMHPIKTGVSTPGHDRVNAGDVWDHDSAAFDRWMLTTGPDGAPAALARLRGDA